MIILSLVIFIIGTVLYDIFFNKAKSLEALEYTEKENLHMIFVHQVDTYDDTDIPDDELDTLLYEWIE